MSSLRSCAALVLLQSALPAVRVWFQHYKFFRRYGLQDTLTVVLSGVLLFVVLFYVYPLKFLFSTLVDRLMGGHGEVRLPNGNVEAAMEPSQIGSLMIIFGVGYLAVFAVFFWLFWHAYRKRKKLELNEFEVFDTRNSLQEMSLHCGIAPVITHNGGGWRFGVRRSKRDNLYVNRSGDGHERDDHGQAAAQNGKTADCALSVGIISLV